MNFLGLLLSKDVGERWSLCKEPDLKTYNN